MSGFDQQRHGNPGEDDDDAGSNESGGEDLREILAEQRHENRWNEHADRPYRDPRKQGHFPTRWHGTMGIAKPSFEAVQLPVGGFAFHHGFDPAQPFRIKWRLVKRIAVSGAGEAAHDAILRRVGARWRMQAMHAPGSRLGQGPARKLRQGALELRNVRFPNAPGD